MDVSVVNQNVVWACGTESSVVKSTNGGTNWNIVNIPVTGLNFLHITAVDENYAWVATEIGRIFRTTNGGINWTEQFYNNPKFIDGFEFFSSSTGVFLSGPAANNDTADFYVTRNGGLNWTLSPNSPVTTLLNYGCMGGLDTNFVWFIDNNKFYRLAGGLYNEWQVITINLNPVFLISYFENANTGYICDGGFGANGFVMIKTTNNGINWSAYSTDSSIVAYTLVFAQNSNLAFVNGSNSIRVSTNSGVNWQYRIEYTSQDSMNFNFMDAKDSNSVWLTNSKGRLLKYNFEYIGITPLSTEIPAGFRVYQNYPNPFNPATKIKFDLPETGEVKIEVFDVLGKLMYEFAEQKTPGTYEFSFDGANMASGIYYFKIASGKYSDTKKMILLK